MPISDCEVRDPRIRRTRRQLQSALLLLMNSKRFDEISVSDVTDAAAVNRATFYDHYTDKFALLNATVAAGFHALLERRGISFDAGSPANTKAIIKATYDYLAETHAGPACSNQSAFEPLMDAAVATALARVMQEGLAPFAAMPITPEILASSIAWAIYAAVKESRLQHPALAEDDLIEAVSKLTANMLGRKRRYTPVP